MKKSDHLKDKLAAIVGLLLLLIFDQWTKLLAISHLKGKADIELLPGVFSLHYLENHGAAFGILRDQQWIFLILAAVFLVAAVILYVRMPFTARMVPLRIITVFTAAGAVGNMIDRIFRHYVVDFLYFSLIDFPVFNVADIYITCCAVLLVLFVVFYYKDEELECIFPQKDAKQK